MNYIRLKTNVINDTTKPPEFDKIYTIIGCSPQLIHQYDLLIFFSEIVLYYDNSGTLARQPIGRRMPMTIEQLSQIYNGYISQKKDEQQQYKILSNQFQEGSY